MKLLRKHQLSRVLINTLDERGSNPNCPLLVLSGNISVEMDSRLPSMLFSDPSITVACQLAEFDASLLGKPVLVMEWSLVDYIDCMLLEIHSLCLRTTWECQFGVSTFDFAFQSRFITDLCVKQPHPTIKHLNAPNALHTKGTVISKSSISGSKDKWLFLIIVSRVVGDNQELLASIVVRGDRLSVYTAYLSIVIGNEYRFYGLQTQKLTSASNEQHQLLSFNSNANDLQLTTRATTSISETGPKSCEWQSPPPLLDWLRQESFFSDLCLDSVNAVTLNYSGYITAVLDATVGVFEVDERYVLVLNASESVLNRQSLRCSAFVCLTNVHVIFSTPRNIAFLVTCPASNVHIARFSTIPLDFVSDNLNDTRKCLTSDSMSDLSFKPGMPFYDWLFSLAIYDALQSIVPSATSDLLSSVRQQVLHMFGYEQVATNHMLMFLNHHKRCDVVRQPGYEQPRLLSPSRLSKNAESVVASMHTQATGLFMHRILNASYFGAKQIATIGKLEAHSSSGRLIITDAQTKLNIRITDSDESFDGLDMLGYVVLVRDFEVVCETIWPSLSHHSTGTSVDYTYIEVSSTNIYALCRVSASPVYDEALLSAKFIFMPTMCLDSVLRYRISREECMELTVYGNCIPYDSDTFTSNKNSFESFIRFDQTSIHLGSLLSPNRIYELRIPEYEAHDLIGNQAIEWDKDWRIKLVDKDVEATIRTKYPDTFTKVAPSTTPSPSSTGDYVMTLTCRIISRKMKPAKDITIGQLVTDAQTYPKRFQVGMGRSDQVVVFQVKNLTGGGEMLIYHDVRTRSFPFGVLPGRIVRFDNVLLKFANVFGNGDTNDCGWAGSQYGSVIPITRLVVLNNANETELPTRNQARYERFRLCDLFSKKLERTTMVLDCVVMKVERVRFSKTCSGCLGTIRDTGKCPSCQLDGNDSFEIKAEVVVVVEDGTAEACVTISEFELVLKVLKIGPKDSMRLTKLVTDQYPQLALDQYATRKRENNINEDTHLSTSGCDDTVPTETIQWLRQMCASSRISRPATMYIPIPFRKHVNRVDSSIDESKVSITCPLDASGYRPRTLRVNDQMLETVAYKRIYLNATDFKDEDALEYIHMKLQSNTIN